MCVISFIGDHYAEKWQPYVPQPVVLPNTTVTYIPQVSREEFDALKREVEDVKALLVKARQYDIDHGEPDCEMDEKLVVLRKVAELVGVDLDEVFG